jgi:hypothetical protein
MIAASGVDELVATFMPYLVAATVALLFIGWFIAVAMAARNRRRVTRVNVLVGPGTGRSGRVRKSD